MMSAKSVGEEFKSKDGCRQTDTRITLLFTKKMQYECTKRSFSIMNSHNRKKWGGGGLPPSLRPLLCTFLCDVVCMTYQRAGGGI